MQRSILILVSLAIASGPSSAFAQDSAIQFVGGPADASLIATDHPVLRIQAAFGTDSGYALRCEVDYVDALQNGPETACGTQDASGCPVDQCWTFEPALHEGSNLISAFAEDSHGARGDSAALSLTVDTTPPGTTVKGPLPGFPPTTPAFRLGAVEDRKDSRPDTFECSLTDPGVAPTSWFSCESEKPLAVRIKVDAQVHHLAVRAVDPLGRRDETPAELDFSQVPCTTTILSRPVTLAGLAKHGMRLRTRCLGARRFTVALVLTQQEYGSMVRRYGSRTISSPGLAGRVVTLGSGGGATTFTLRTLTGLPEVLLHQRHLAVQLTTFAGTPERPELGKGAAIRFTLNP
jgi:hypothetical protein